MNNIKTSWIRDLCSTANIDFFSIQEHFNATKSSYKFFCDQFPTYNPYVIPAVRSKNQTTGRPKGGIAQFMILDFKIESERISTKSDRIQAQILVFPAIRVLWINTYLPNDPLTIEFDDNELLNVLHEVESIFDTHNFDDCIWVP